VPVARLLVLLLLLLGARASGTKGLVLQVLQSYLGFSELRGCSDFMFVPGSNDCHIFVMRVMCTLVCPSPTLACLDEKEQDATRAFPAPPSPQTPISPPTHPPHKSLASSSPPGAALLLLLLLAFTGRRAGTVACARGWADDGWQPGWVQAQRREPARTRASGAETRASEGAGSRAHELRPWCGLGQTEETLDNVITTYASVIDLEAKVLMAETIIARARKFEGSCWLGHPRPRPPPAPCLRSCARAPAAGHRASALWADEECGCG
jgi:hypothetical protein